MMNDEKFALQILPLSIFIEKCLSTSKNIHHSSFVVLEPKQRSIRIPNAKRNHQ
jgi:hypothetical protein